MRASLLALPVVFAISIGLAGCSAAETASQFTFGAERTEAADLAAKTDVSNAKVAVIGYQTNTPDVFPSVDELAPWGYTPSEGVATVVLTGTSSMDFCVSATSETGTVFHATGEAIGIAEGACP